MKNEEIATRFKRFAKKECKDSCTLYEILSYQIAVDPDLLTLASHARDGQPIPNLFFGSVHYLLSLKSNEKLGRFYGSVVDSPDGPELAFSHFKQFCMKHENEIKKLLETKLVQTNEVRRCAYLYPVFGHVYDFVKKPLALVEIGTSAGLQLFWDQYSYTYGDGKIYGNQDSSLVISSSVDQKITFTHMSPPVSHRIGIDLHTNDLTYTEDQLWLKALIWPSHHERREMFEKAAAHVQQNPPTFIEGNGVDKLSEIANEISNNSLLCVFHTHVANQMPDNEKKRLVSKIVEIGKTRDVIHLYNNMYDAELHLDWIINGKKHQDTVGKTDGHARWFEWKLSH